MSVRRRADDQAVPIWLLRVLTEQPDIIPTFYVTSLIASLKAYTKTEPTNPYNRGRHDAYLTVIKRLEGMLERAGAFQQPEDGTPLERPR